MLKLTLFALVVSVTIALSVQELNENEKYLRYEIQQLKEHFERNITGLNKEIDDLRNLVDKNSNACENGWFAYLDQKCIKSIEKKGTVDEGVQACAALDKQANLLSIHSEYEMSFLSQHLSKYSDISDNAWIGLKFNGKGFEWFDKTALDYQHWDEDAVKDGKLPCVQMSLTKSSLGKWKDELCNRKNLIVCQKKQSTNSVLSVDLKNISKVVDQQEVKIASHELKLNQQNTIIMNQQNSLNQQQTKINKLEQNPVPIGFIYVQLWGQPEPHTLWPNTQWDNISPKYAGLFFRAEGGGANSFGNVQDQQTQSIEMKSDFLRNLVGDQYWEKNLKISEKLNVLKTGGFGIEWAAIAIKHNLEEIRPRNQAIRIWIRIK